MKESKKMTTKCIYDLYLLKDRSIDRCVLNKNTNCRNEALWDVLLIIIIDYFPITVCCKVFNTSLIVLFRFSTTSAHQINTPPDESIKLFLLFTVNLPGLCSGIDFPYKN